MKKLKILVVEDEILIGLHLKQELARIGYEIIGPVASGKEAIAKVKTENPDVVLMDIRLIGNMDGIEAAQEISLFSSAEIIFMTGYQDSALKERAVMLNPLDYLSKPIEVSRINAILRKNKKLS
jgi:YesN/AraC family two-component response regulator